MLRKDLRPSLGDTEIELLHILVVGDIPRASITTRPFSTDVTVVKMTQGIGVLLGE
jgi:hypothetical protein